jgi:hypothetical protein
VFKAALASIRLEQFDWAADWITEGVRLADLYRRPNDVTAFRDQLIQLREARPELAEGIETLLELLSE